MLRKSDFKRILIVRLSAIGDVVVTTPVAKALRGAFPEAHIAWIVEDKSKEILEGNPYLDEVIVWDRSKTKNTPLGYLRSALHLRRELVKRHFDVAIDFQLSVLLTIGSLDRIFYQDKEHLLNVT